MRKSSHLVISTGKRQAPVFDVFEAFLNTDNIQVFANAATSYIMCLMKFVKGLGKYFPIKSWYVKLDPAKDDNSII